MSKSRKFKKSEEEILKDKVVKLRDRAMVLGGQYVAAYNIWASSDYVKIHDVYAEAFDRYVDACMLLRGLQKKRHKK